MNYSGRPDTDRGNFQASSRGELTLYLYVLNEAVDNLLPSLGHVRCFLMAIDYLAFSGQECGA